MNWKVGDVIEVIDRTVVSTPIRGEILEVDGHPFKESYAKIRAQSAALPAPEVWVNLRLARRLAGRGMMTAEQSKYRIDIPTETKFMRLRDGVDISTEATECEMELAAQLAEKELEIATLHAEIEQDGQLFADLKKQILAYASRTEQAEKRLKEAQVEITQLQAWKESQIRVTPDWQKIGELLNVGLGQSVTENIIPAITDLRERLRQREAELEQAQRGRQAAWDSEFELRRQVADLTAAILAPPRELC